MESFFKFMAEYGVWEILSLLVTLVPSVLVLIYLFPRKSVTNLHGLRIVRQRFGGFGSDDVAWLARQCRDQVDFDEGEKGPWLSNCFARARRSAPSRDASLDERNDFENPSPAPAGDLTSRDDNILTSSARWVICKLIN